MEFELQQVTSNTYAFEYKVDGELLADIHWVQEGDTMVMNHTVVSPKLRGQGVAKKLLDRAADYAREHGYKMKPICSYVVAAFEKSTEYDDLKK